MVERRTLDKGELMDYSQVIAEIDAQIERLQKARSAIVGLKGSTGAQSIVTRSSRRGGRRRLSASARARIAAAQRARWAKFKRRRGR